MSAGGSPNQCQQHTARVRHALVTRLIHRQRTSLDPDLWPDLFSLFTVFLPFCRLCAGGPWGWDEGPPSRLLKYSGPRARPRTPAQRCRDAQAPFKRRGYVARPSWVFCCAFGRSLLGCPRMCHALSSPDSHGQFSSALQGLRSTSTLNAVPCPLGCSLR